MGTFDEVACLDVNPFEGDFGAPDDRVLEDKIVTTRKAAKCGCCMQDAQPGERSRVIAAIFDGQLMRYRFCAACCAAMAKCWDEDDDGETWAARARMGREAADAKGGA
ncbi:hypothetical protein [Chitiniphilus eburneus]|uniref:Uncharacterized protein n=1 Tax=Chitiniphilus eburneus TaxID=2571148 RepID=A0A4U0Q3G6_9NEIS|nr:hypothetical protein [Chitiniphilus eburneus]TJZ75617.1 hypothetical protein FAZ21_06805 [Chitiniphilus eburneus]